MMRHWTVRIFRRALIAFGVLLAGVVALATSPPPLPARPLLAISVGASYRGADGVRFQQDAADCGVAALEMLFDAFAITSHTLEPVRDRVAARDSGLSMLELRDLAVAHGLTATGMRMNLPALGRARLPAIASFPEHWVVVDRVTPDGVELRDPAIGRLRMTHARFDRRWTGHVLLIGNAP